MAFATAAHFRRSLHIGGVAVLAAGIVGCATKASTVMHSEPAAQAEIIPDSDPSPSPPPPPVPAQTTTTACTPIGVFRLKATNQTQSKGDLCARFEAAVMQTSMPSIQPPNNFELSLTLRKMDLAAPPTCRVAIEVRASGKNIALVDAGAVVRGGPQPNHFAAGDCIDTVLRYLLTKIAPIVSQNVVPSGATGSGATTPAP
jgi:hypothetical protein